MINSYKIINYIVICYTIKIIGFKCKMLLRRNLISGFLSVILLKLQIQIIYYTIIQNIYVLYIICVIKRNNNCKNTKKLIDFYSKIFESSLMTF